MAWSLVASGKSGDGGGLTHVLKGLNTTGATLLVAVGSGWTGNNGISDSKGNTWIPLNESGDSNNSSRIFYCYLGQSGFAVGSGHDFSAQYTYTRVAVTAWTGNAASPFDVQAAGGRTTSGLPLYTGSATPTQNDSLIISGISLGKTASACTISDGLTVAATAPGENFGWYGASITYLVQSTAAAINPGWSWTFTPNADGAAALAVFKPAATGNNYTQTASGILVPSGSIITRSVFGKPVSGNITPAGIVSKKIALTKTGSFSPSGNASKTPQKALQGSTSPSGILGEGANNSKALTGVLTLSGALAVGVRFFRSYASSLTLTGTITKKTLKGLSGSFTLAGSVAKGMFLKVVGSITPSGAVNGFKFTPTVSSVISTTLRSIRRFIGRR